MTRVALVAALIAFACIVWAVIADLRDASEDGAEDVHPVHARPRVAPRTERARRPGESTVGEQSPAEATAAGPSDAPGTAVVVLRTDGTPHGGARVTIVRPRDDPDAGVTRTADAEGRASFTAAEIARAASILVAGDEGEAAALTWRAEGTSAEITARIGPAVRVTGRVAGTGGEPVVGATCDLDLDADRHGEPKIISLREPSIERGEFAFPPVPRPRADQRLRLRVSAQGHAAVDVGPDAVAAGEPLVVTLARLVVVRGRCVDEFGRRVGPAWVTAGRVSNRSRDDGSFVLEKVRSDDSVSIHVDGFRAVTVTSLPVLGGEADLGEVVCRRGLTITGVFVEAEGTPIPDAHVGARPTPSAAGTSATPDMPTSATTDASGRFELSGLADGPYTVSAHPPGSIGGAGQAREEDARAGVNLRLVAVRKQDVRFRLRLAPDGGALATREATVLILDAITRRTVDAGSVRIWHDRPPTSDVIVRLPRTGTFVAEIDVPGFATARVPAFEVAADRETRIEVEFTKRSR